MSNKIKFSQHKNDQHQNPPQVHSGIGITSFILSLILFPAWILLFFYAGYMQVSAQKYGAQGISEEVALIVGLFFFFLLAANILSLLLGIVGCMQKEKKKIFAILGLVFSFFAFLLTMIIFLIGLIAQNAI